MKPNNDTQREIESKIDGAVNTAQFFKDKNLSTFKDEDLMHLLGRLLEISQTYRLDTYVDLVREEFRDRKNTKLHQENRRIAVLAIIVSIAAAVGTVIQAALEIWKFTCK